MTLLSRLSHPSAAMRYRAKVEEQKHKQLQQEILDKVMSKARFDLRQPTFQWERAR